MKTRMREFLAAIGGNRRQSAAMRRGFTLIELLTVMAVMILITTVVVASGFGLRRSSTYNSALQVPQNIFEYAHQRACMDGRKTAVLFAPNRIDATGGSGDVGEFAAYVFQAVGTVSMASKSGSAFDDRFSDIAEISSGARLLSVFNFKSGKMFVVDKIVKYSGNQGNPQETKTRTNPGGDATVGYGTEAVYYAPFVEITSIPESRFSSSDWDVGSDYGFEIIDRQIMPANFDYSLAGGGKSVSGSKDSFFFVFNPDGTNGGGSGDMKINVRETVGNKKFSQTISYGG